MPYPNVPFKDADDWTPELATLAFNTPIFDGTNDLLGHRAKLKDTELDDNGVKLRLANVTDNLKVSIDSGVLLRYRSGRVLLNHQGVSIAGGLIAVGEGVSFVYVDRVGVVAANASLPAVSLPLAKVNVVNGVISSLEDIRALTDTVLPRLDIIRTFGGSNTEDKVFINGEVLDQGEYFFRNVEVPVGVTITVAQLATISCSGNFVVKGTINVSTLTSGGQSFSASVPAGGGTIPNKGTGLGNNGDAYAYGVQPYGSGGQSGNLFNFSNVPVPLVGQPAGAGGGALIVNAAGFIRVENTGIIKAEGTIGGGLTNISSLVNGQNIHPFGTIGEIGLIAGQGGGSGGFIKLSAVQSLRIDGTISVKGGQGTIGLAKRTDTRALFAGSGVGGAGGVVLLMSSDINTTFSNINTSPGDRNTPAILGDFTNPSPNVWETTYANPYVNGGGSGGGFGGKAGGYGLVKLDTIYRVTYTPSQFGKLITRNFLPVA